MSLYEAHFGRHRAESGRGDYHFMPFNPQDPDGPRIPDLDRLGRSLDQPGWQRYWIAWNDPAQCIVGHVDLKGSLLKTALHRCELGIGIEREFRGQGIGKRLMETAIGFASDAHQLAWIDLSTFGHNQNAIALYRSLGFTRTGFVTDRFRIDGQSIDDLNMTLSVTS